ncbi:restriction endonuclease [Neobacillus vireti]|nr:restriction endonuclease [Neobacillus vireti]
MDSLFDETDFDESIDVSENNILRESPELLNILLKDRTTKKNIMWATDSYERMGTGFSAEDPIKPELITGKNSTIIRPRVEKAKHEQKARTRERAEVFTPTLIVKKQNDIIEKDFEGLALEEYINKFWLEITCGEAPYMVTRYDTVTGDEIAINERVGFVDRKLQRINHEVSDKEEWIALTTKSFQTSFGYEFQGDSLLLARENLLYTFIDYYEDKFGEKPDMETKQKIAKIISHNVFQMDGLQYTVPFKEWRKFNTLTTL